MITIADSQGVKYQTGMEGNGQRQKNSPNKIINIMRRKSKRRDGVIRTTRRDVQ